MNVLTEIQKPIEGLLLEFNNKYARVLRSEIHLLDDMAQHISQRKGKQIRATFTYLSALICGQATEQTSRTAIAIELLHTSTLVHDDVVDNASYRRGVYTINERWSNKLAVLFGDYLLSMVLRILSENDDHSILKVLSKVASQMSEGEILQQQVSGLQDYSEKSYLDVIKKKTAALLAACFEGGSLSVNANPEEVVLLKEVGESVGMAFQIQDDLFDYMPQLNTGKMYGNDIRERKFTLPLIGYMNEISSSEKSVIIDIFSSQDLIPEDTIKCLIKKVSISTGMDYAKDRMNEYVQLALNKLDYFPDSEIKTTLKNAILYTIKREL